MDSANCFCQVSECAGLTLPVHQALCWNLAENGRAEAVGLCCPVGPAHPGETYPSALSPVPWGLLCATLSARGVRPLLYRDSEPVAVLTPSRPCPGTCSPPRATCPFPLSHYANEADEGGNSCRGHCRTPARPRRQNPCSTATSCTRKAADTAAQLETAPRHCPTSQREIWNFFF